jgi:twitching motility protein PilT
METLTQPPVPQTTAPPRVIHTAQLIAAMLKSNGHVSDLIFSPGRAPQIEVSGQLVELKYKGLERLTAADTKSIAYDIMGDNEHPLRKLDQDGSADLSYGLPGVGRFRVNIFRQRGSCAIVMRVIPDNIPGFADLKLPASLEEVVHLKNGIVLVTGPTGSGKSSTLAAIIDKMNTDKAFHILTIEDPIEFLHKHKKATIHQRELHSDTPTFALALRGALRQAPKVILVGEMRDRETIEIALEAAETGHLVMSTLHTVDASKTVERIVGAFPVSDQHSVRMRFGKAFRFIISQRLMPKKDGKGRVAAIEILKSTLRTRDYVEKGEGEGKTLLDAMRDGDTDGMQHFDGELEKLLRAGTIDFETAIAYSTNPGNLRLELADLLDGTGKTKESAPTEIEIEP